MSPILGPRSRHAAGVTSSAAMARTRVAPEKLRAQSTTVVAAPFQEFLADLEELRASVAPEPHVLAEVVRRRLGGLVAESSWLPAWARVGDEDHYHQHILHVAPDGGYSVVALVWQPDQCTAIHDHVSWCVVGVLEGEETQVHYRLWQTDGGRYLVAEGTERATPGQCSAIVPPNEDIHKVTNTGSSTAISIHVYGADIGKLGTSINHRFDDLPVRAKPDRRDVELRWRASGAPPSTHPRA